MGKKEVKRQVSNKTGQKPSFLQKYGGTSALLILVAFVLYGNTLNHEFVLDDDVVFLQNKYVQKGFSGIPDIVSHGFLTGFNGSNDQSYRPLVLINYAIERQLFDNNPKAGHFFNILFYALCGILVWRLAKRMFKTAHAWIPIGIALVFMAHPVHTEVIANIKGRDDILHFLFALTSLHLLLRYTESQKTKDLVLSGLTFFGALLCKEMAITFLAIFPLSLWFFSNWSWKKIGTNSAMFLGITAIYFLIRSAVLDDITFNEPMHVANNAVAAADGFTGQLATGLLIMVVYVKLLFFPHPLSWDYSFEQIPVVGLGDWQASVSILILAGLVFVAIKGFMKKASYSWAILYFLISISIVSNIVILLGATVADRFLFTPSLGFAIALVMVLAKVLKVDTAHKDLPKQRKLVAPILVILCLFSIKTIARNRVWKSNDTLFEAGVKDAPKSTRTWAALASHYRAKAERNPNAAIRQQQLKTALSHYKKSVEILDANFESWYNMGVTHNMMGNPQKGFECYKKAAEENPRYTNALNNIGVHYVNGNQLDSAAKYFEKVIALDPSHVDGTTNLGLTFHKRNDYPNAIQWYLKALEIDPRNRNAAKNLGIAYRSNGEPDKAVVYEKIANTP